MATTTNPFILANLLVGLLLFNSFDFTAGQVGVCFGRQGNNLPGVQRTLALYKKYNIRKKQLFDPHPPTLRALAGTGIRLMMGVPAESIQDLANCPQAATAWVRRYVLQYPNVTFRGIFVGYEIDPTSLFAPFVLPAMQNVYRAIRAAGLARRIKVSTSIKTDLLNTMFPPQAGEFKCSVNWYIRPILEFLRDTDTPLLASVFPVLAYMNDSQNINLSFALLQPNSGVIYGGVYYDNLFYAMLDAVEYAIDRILAASPPLLLEEVIGKESPPPNQKGSDKVTTSSGAYSQGGGGGTAPSTAVDYTTALGDGPIGTVQNARIYNNNLIRIVKKGTPRNPNRTIDTYIFAMYDENLRPGPPYIRHFGIFTPKGNGQPKYPIRFY